MENNQIKESRRVRYTKKALCESLMELMKTRPISAISIKELCAKADISRSSFYTYYADQHDLLRKIEEETLAFIDNLLNKYDAYKNDKRAALQMLEETLHYVADNNKSIYVLFSENGNINFQKNLFSSMYKKSFSNSFLGKLPGEETRQYYYLFFVTGTIGIIYHWINNNMNTPINELAKLIIKITSGF